MKRIVSPPAVRFMYRGILAILILIIIVGLFRPAYVRNLFSNNADTNDYTLVDIQENQTANDKTTDSLDEVNSIGSEQSTVIPIGTTNKSLTVAGLERTYVVYVPVNVAIVKTPIDILIVFHGTGGSGEGIRDVGFDAYAESANFITVYPDSLTRDEKAKWDPTNRQIKDIDFTKALITELQNSIDGGVGNVYVAGMSNGSVMAQAVGCLVLGIDGVAGVSAGIGSEMIPYCNLAEPIPFIGFYGTLDRFGEIEKYELSVAHFATENGCTESYTALVMPDTDPNDGTTVEKRIYQAVNDKACGTPVHYYRIEGGGHFWPGAEKYRADRLDRNSGFVSKDVDATKLIVDFFGLDT